MNDTVDDVIAIVRRTFDLVSLKLALRGPKLKRDNMSFSLGYFGKSVGYEVVVDLLPFHVFVLPFRMSDHDDVPIGYIDASGVRQKRYLQDSLARLRINYEKEDRELRQLGGNWDNCEKLAGILAELLNKNWHAISENEGELFSGSG